jgi:hypothetical protein
VIISTCMPLAVTTNGTVIISKILSGAFSGAWILSQLSLTIIQTTETENHHRNLHFYTSSTAQSFIVLITSIVRLLCLVSVDKLGRGLTCTSHRIVLELTNVSLSQIEMISS